MRSTYHSSKLYFIYKVSNIPNEPKSLTLFSRFTANTLTVDIVYSTKSDFLDYFFDDFEPCVSNKKDILIKALKKKLESLRNYLF